MIRFFQLNMSQMHCYVCTHARSFLVRSYKVNTCMIKFSAYLMYRVMY